MEISGNLEVADRLFRAIEAGDIDTVRELYAPGAIIWHNHDQREQTPAENLAVLRWVVKNIVNLKYTAVRRQTTPSGFVQQHVLSGRFHGHDLALPACIVATVEAGRIARLDEYLDSAQTAILAA
ncbi:MAG: nuclear transport factor 2 family protein [Candidatus Binataceae bacterium]